MIASTIINGARQILHDTEADFYRWTDLTLFGYLNDAQRMVKQHRPEYWLAEDGGMNNLVLVTALNTNLNLANDLTETLTNYVIFKALSEDDADLENLNRAQIYKKMFDTSMRGE